MLTNGRRGSVYVTGKNERNAITNALINRIDKVENAEIKIITINKVQVNYENIKTSNHEQEWLD